MIPGPIRHPARPASASGATAGAARPSPAAGAQPANDNPGAPAAAADSYASAQPPAAAATAGSASATPQPPDSLRRSRSGPSSRDGTPRAGVSGASALHEAATSPGTAPLPDGARVGRTEPAGVVAGVEHVDEHGSNEIAEAERHLQRAKDQRDMLDARVRDPNSAGGAAITPEERMRMTRAEREVSAAQERVKLAWQLKHTQDQCKSAEAEYREFRKNNDDLGPPSPVTQELLDRKFEELVRLKLRLQEQTDQYRAYMDEVTRSRANGVLNPTPPDGTPPW